MKTSCPDETILARFLEKKLSNEQKESIINHLAICDHCLQKVAFSSSFSKDEELMKLEQVTISDEQAKSILLNTKQKKYLTKIKKSILHASSIVEKWFQDKIYNIKRGSEIQFSNNIQYSYATVRNKSDKSSDNICIKEIESVTIELHILSTTMNKNELQLNISLSDKKWEDSRIYLKHYMGRLISSRTITKEPIVFKNLLDGKYILEFIKTVDMVNNSKEINNNIKFIFDIYQGKASILDDK